MRISLVPLPPPGLRYRCVVCSLQVCSSLFFPSSYFPVRMDPAYKMHSKEASAGANLAQVTSVRPDLEGAAVHGQGDEAQLKLRFSVFSMAFLWCVSDLL